MDVTLQINFVETLRSTFSSVIMVLEPGVVEGTGSLHTVSLHL